MEPSLHSSNARPQECKLRRCQEAVHETTQRFVERFSQDIRISQYADVAFATKKMENHSWFWLEPAGRTGFLVCLPNQSIVWIDEQLKISYKIPIRVRSSIFEKKSLFLASLNQSEGTLRIEDCWMHCGTFLRDQPFRNRWQTVAQFFLKEYRLDTVVQQGFLVEPATFLPLTAAKKWETSPPALMFAQGDVYPRRLRVSFVQGQGQGSKPVVPIAKKPVALFVNDDEDEEEEKEEDVSIEEGKLKALAVAHEEHPDTYTLWVNGKKKGFGAVQDLDLSRRLRQALAVSTGGKVKKEIGVEISWNEEFRMYEISSLLSTE